MNNCSLIDRIISVLTYYTFGLVGLGWIILCALTKTPLPRFTKYHIWQSIFLSVVLSAITLLIEIGISFTISLPFIGNIIKKIVIYTAQTPIYLGFSLINCIIFIIITYLAIFAFFGKYSYFPYISDIVKTNTEGR